MTRQPLTKAGVERLREEVARLKKVDRPKIIAAIAVRTFELLAPNSMPIGEVITLKL